LIAFAGPPGCATLSTPFLLVLFRKLFRIFRHFFAAAIHWLDVQQFPEQSVAEST